MTPNLNLDELASGLGTDGMQANMLREAKEGMLIRSSHLPGGASSPDYMQLLFKNNPEIASKLFGRKIGRIMPGYQADLQFLIICQELRLLNLLFLVMFFLD